MPRKSSNSEWSTPDKLFKWLDSRFHFTLDAASTHKNAKCELHYTQKENGLTSPWHPGFTFCNPPFSNVDEWIVKALTEWKRDRRKSLLIVPVRSDREWWHQCVIGGLCHVEWYKNRIKFGNSTGSAFMYNVNLIFGPLDLPIVKSIDANDYNDR